MTCFDTPCARITTPSHGLCSLLLLLLFIGLPRCGDAAPPLATRAILILGDSLSAGYGIALKDSWPALLDAKLQAEGYPYRVVNASISGETTAGGARRIGALLTEHQPAVVVVALGANDGLRAIDPAGTRQNLTSTIAAAEQAGARVVLSQVRVPPNYGPQYTAAFEAVYGELATANGRILAPFMLERFAADRAAFQSDGLHPIAAMEPLILETLWPALKTAMRTAAAKEVR